jgi:hypothetical protein
MDTRSQMERAVEGVIQAAQMRRRIMRLFQWTSFFAAVAWFVWWLK